MKTYATIEEAVLDMFFVQSLGQPVRKLKKGSTLKDLCPDKKFEKEYINLYVDKIQAVFGTNIKNLKNKPVAEILDFLTEKKRKDAIYGNRPFKKSRY